MKYALLTMLALTLACSNGTYCSRICKGEPSLSDKIFASKAPQHRCPCSRRVR